MKYLISGISSFLGFELAKELAKRGEEIFGIVRPASVDNFKNLCKKEGIRLSIIELDMDNIFALTDVLKEEIDICLHFAWAGIGAVGRNDKSIQEKNFNNTLEFMKVLAKLSCKRFIFAGSQAEYGITYERILNGEEYDMPCTESHITLPLSEYGKTKLRILNEGRELADRLGMEYIHLRIFSIYGSRDHETSLVSTCLKFCRGNNKNTKLKLSECVQKWNYMFESDFARAVCDLSLIPYKNFMEFQDKDKKTLKTLDEKTNISSSEAAKNCLENNKRKRIYSESANVPIVNIASKDTKKLREFALEIAEIFAKKELFEFEKKEVSIENTPYLNPSIEKLVTLTGYEDKISFKEGINLIEKLHIM